MSDEKQPATTPSTEDVLRARVDILTIAVERLVDRVARLEDAARAGEKHLSTLTDVIRSSKIGGLR